MAVARPITQIGDSALDWGVGQHFGVYVNRYLRKILSFSLYLWDSRVNLQYHEPSLILEDLQLELVESFIPPNVLLNNMSLN